MPCSPKPPAPSSRNIGTVCPLCETYEYENHPLVVQSTVVIQHDEIHPLKAFLIFFFFCKGLILPHDGVSLRIKQYIIILSYPRAIYNTFLWRNNLLSIGNSCPLCKVISLAENQSGNQKDKLSSTVSGWATTRTSKVKTGTEDNLRDANWCRIAMEYTLFVTVLKQIITTVRNK